jgi:type VI protein secretion system component VasK
MSQNPSFDSSIPVLTEVVVETLPAGQAEAEAAIAVAEELAEAEPETSEPEASAASETALQALPEPDWDALEARIAERVVAQLQPQINAVVRNALASAADQIHIGLRQAIEQVVAQQVAAIQFGQK